MSKLNRLEKAIREQIGSDELDVLKNSIMKRFREDKERGAFSQGPRAYLKGELQGHRKKMARFYQNAGYDAGRDYQLGYAA